VWQLPGVVVVLVDVVVVWEPPAGVGIVTLALEDEVVDGGASTVVVVIVVDVVVVGGVVVCAKQSGMASARLTQSAPAARNSFMRKYPGPRTDLISNVSPLYWLRL
jgi:hypothetical protein